MKFAGQKKFDIVKGKFWLEDLTWLFVSKSHPDFQLNVYRNFFCSHPEVFQCWKVELVACLSP